MTDFVQMDQIPINSATAAASLSLADATYSDVKRHDTDKLTIGNVILSSLVGIVAITGVTSAFFSMWMEASLVTCVAFAFPLITGPCILVQRKKIQWMPTFKEQSNKLRMSVNQLAIRRMQLSIEVGRMERQVRRMKAIEDRFQYVVEREGKSVQEFRKLVQENAQVLMEIKKTQAAGDLMDLFSVIMTSDRNEDDKVTASEADEFMLRIRAFAGRRDKILDEDMILKAFKQSMKNTANAHSTGSMFNIVQNAMSDNTELQSQPTAQSTQDNNKEQSTTIGQTNFVQLNKVPRVTPTGLVLSESHEEEGNLAHPIKVEDLRQEVDDELFNAVLGTLSDDKTKPSTMEAENIDIVSMILQSFSSGPTNRW